MKNLFILIFSFIFFLSINVNAEKVDTLKFSGNISFLTQTNSLLSGGRFSENPGIELNTNLSYKKFNLTLIRNSDLLSSTSAGNFVLINGSYKIPFTKKTELTLLAAVRLFDTKKDMDIIAPFFTLSHKTFVDINLMGVYGKMLKTNDDVYIARIVLAKNFKSYDFKVYGWYMKTKGELVNETRYSSAFEIGKKINKSFWIQTNYHFNNFSNKEKKLEFGVIKICYFF